MSAGSTCREGGEGGDAPASSKHGESHGGEIQSHNFFCEERYLFNERQLKIVSIHGFQTPVTFLCDKCDL